MAVDPEKVKAVVEWTTPTSVFKIQSFLRLAGYYQHFIKGLSKLLTSLTLHVPQLQGSTGVSTPSVPNDGVHFTLYGSPY
jgi:hypothetical protein